MPDTARSARQTGSAHRAEGTYVNEYTVIIEERDETGEAWLPLAPAENVTNEGTAEEVARWTADNDTMAAAGTWRVRVWESADADQDQPEAACSELERF
jgi:hypothetical protein